MADGREKPPGLLERVGRGTASSLESTGFGAQLVW